MNTLELQAWFASSPQSDVQWVCHQAKLAEATFPADLRPGPIAGAATTAMIELAIIRLRVRRETMRRRP